jgi:hypothetical protein
MMYTQTNKSSLLAVVPILGIMLACSTAFGFDSGCKKGNEECAPGPESARGDWHGSLEHQLMWQYTSDIAGLPSQLLEAYEVTAYTNGSTVNVNGSQEPSLIPAEFTAATQAHNRSIYIADFSQLADLSYSLWDWASGNETCPLGNGIATEACHDLKIHNGAVNSNHFVPQAFETYKHYHDLAMDMAKQCASVANAAGPNPSEHLLNDYLLPCEKLALLYESIGHHFLQDAWSMGHMWERWGSSDKDLMSDHFDALAVGATTGLIHGVRSSFQEQLGFLGDFNDALCAPVHEEVRFKYPDSDVTYPATGDLYFDAVIAADESANLHEHGEFSEQKRRLLSCGAQGMLEVYRASGQFHGTASPSHDLEDVDPTLEADCFGQRATNAAMKKGGGIDVLWGGFWPYHLEIDSYTATTAVLVGSADAADNYDDLSWWELWRKQSQYRRDLSRMVSKMALYAKIDPEGTQLATGGLGELMNIQPNGYYVDIGRGVASYSDVSLGKHRQAQPSKTLTSTAVTRLFQDAYGPVWCDRYSGPEGYEALATLKSRVAQAPNSEHQAAACGVCASVVKRHIRHSMGSQQSDPNQKPLCQYAYEAGLLDTAPLTIYHNGSGSTPAALAADWCGCPTLN